MEIRPLKKPDLPEALSLIYEVFDEFESPDYPPEGVAEFRSSVNLDSIREKMEEGMLTMKGCHDDNTLTGVIAVRNTNHITLLFVRKEYHRRGIARQLFEAVVEDIKSAGCTEITVNSSPYAVEAYHHLGFVDTDMEQEVNGIRFTPMVKKIET